jgi:hypothetical protein
MSRSVFNYRRALLSRYREEVLADGPLLYWRLGESSGTTAEDETANNRDGTYTNPTPNLTYSVTGPLASDFDTAVRMVDATDHPRVLRAASTDWDSTDLTIEMWVSALTSDTNFAHMAQVGDSTTTNWRWVLCARRTTAGNPLQIRKNGLTTGGPQSSSTGTDLDVGGGWHHIVVTWDGTEWAFWLDGSAIGTHTGDGPDTGVTNQPFIVGATDADSTGGASFDGEFDEVALYDYALSSTRIAAHYNASL